MDTPALSQTRPAPASKTDWITFASVVSCAAVVALHANGCFWTFSATARWWATANVIESACYFAVPVFFMISGATLLEFYDRYSLREYFRRRVVKTLVPYLFWSLFNVVYSVATGSVAASDVTIGWLLDGLGGGSFPSIYWFFIPLFSVYLSVPLFAAVRDDLRRPVYSYVAIAGFVLGCVLPFLEDVCGFDTHVSLSIDVAFGYLLFLPIGYLLAHYELAPRAKRIIYALGVLALAVHMAGTYVGSMEAGTVVRTFKGYTSLLGVTHAVAVFVFLKDVGTRLMEISWVGRLVRFLGKYTFAVYLLHYYVLLNLRALPWVSCYSIVYRLGAVVPVFAAVILVTWLVRKVPVLRRVLP